MNIKQISKDLNIHSNLVYKFKGELKVDFINTSKVLIKTRDILGDKDYYEGHYGKCPSVLFKIYKKFGEESYFKLLPFLKKLDKLNGGFFTLDNIVNEYNNIYNVITYIYLLSNNWNMQHIYPIIPENHIQNLYYKAGKNRVSLLMATLDNRNKYFASTDTKEKYDYYKIIIPTIIDFQPYKDIKGFLHYYIHDNIWFSCFNKKPQRQEVYNLPKDIIIKLKETNSFKYFLKFLHEKQEFDSHFLIAVAKITIIYGNESLKFMGKSISELHDIGINLPLDVSKEGKQAFISRGKDLYSIQTLIKVHNNYQYVINKGLNWNSPFKKLDEFLRILCYENIIHEDLAIECAKHSISQYEFEKLQEMWSNLKFKEKDIPNIEISNDEYKIYRLHEKDPRVLFMGHYTDCCQHIFGYGSSCVEHSLYNKNGSVFVVEKHGQIVAQSWVWKYKNNICFDNIEALSGHHNNNSILELYKQLSDKLKKQYKIKNVYIGLGFDDMGLKNYYNPTTNPLPIPEDCYTDARTVVEV